MLEETIRAKMSKANISYQKLADDIGENVTTVWRTVKKPLSARATVLFKIVRYLEIGWDDYARLLAEEVDGAKESE